VKLYSFSPDADPLQPGVLVDCEHTVPSYRGIQGAPSAVNAGLSTATAQTVIGAASVLLLDGSARTFEGTVNDLYEQAGTAWAKVTRSSTVYISVTDRWRFAQFGNVTLAASRENILQYSNTSGKFDNVTSTASGATVTAPLGSVVETVGDFVFLANISNGPSPYNADQPDRWWASAQGDYSDWTPSVSTQSVTGRVTSVAGKITAIRRFGNQLVLYKRRGMYVGSYVGAPTIWDFQLIPSPTGTWCQESVLDIGTPEQPLHFFVGEEDIFLFDGARPTPIGEGVREWFFARLNTAAADKICLLHDRRNTRVYIFYPAGGSTGIDSGLVFNYRKKRWGRDDQSIQFAFAYLDPGVNYAGLGSIAATYGAFPNAPYGSAFGSQGEIQPAVFGTDYLVYLLNGASTSSSITTGDIGNDSVFSCLSRFKPRWLTKPASATLNNYYRNNFGDTATLDTSTAMDAESRFDVLRSARWHRFQASMSGDWETNEATVVGVEDGAE
jgi:hypothetical protein